MVKRLSRFIPDPPISPPVIHNSTSQGFVYQGDPLTLTCTVTGGKPVSNTSVTFVCPGKTDTSDVTSTTDVSSSVTYSAVEASDNGAVCTCSAQWKSYDWYTLTASTSINVYCEFVKGNNSMLMSENSPYFG